MKDFFVSASTATGRVTVDSEFVITASPAIWNKFRGQTLYALVSWLGRRQGPVLVEELPCNDSTPSR